MKKIIILLSLATTFLNAVITITNDSIQASGGEKISLESSKKKPSNENFQKGAYYLENNDFSQAKTFFELGAKAGDEKSKKILNLASKINKTLPNEAFSKKLLKTSCQDDSLLEEFEDSCQSWSIFSFFATIKATIAASNLRTFISDLTSYYLANDDFSPDLETMTSVELEKENNKFYFQVSGENCLRVVFGTNYNQVFQSSTIVDATSLKFIVNNIDEKSCQDFFKKQAVKEIMGFRKAELGASKVYQIGGSKVVF